MYVSVYFRKKYPDFVRYAIDEVLNAKCCCCQDTLLMEDILMTVPCCHFFVDNVHVILLKYGLIMQMMI